MSVKNRIIRGILRWLWVKYPYLMKDIVVPEHAHIGWNPGHKPQSGADKILAEIERQGKIHPNMAERYQP